VLNLDRLSVQEHGSDLELRPKAFEVLRLLVENAGRVLSKDELVAAVWPGIFVNDDALAQCVRDIRKALRDDDQRYIRTVPKRGYMFVAGVVSLEAVPSDALSSPIPRLAWLGAAVIVVALAGLAAWFGRGGDDAAASAARMTIAVLPFETPGAAADESWLGEGVAEDVMTALSRFRDIAVIARNSSFRYGGQAFSVEKVQQDLGADFALRGSVQRRGEHLRITAQLLDAKTGTVRWAGQYDRPYAELFAVDEDVADNIASQLFAEARDATIGRVRNRPPASLKAYELAVRGRRAYVTFTRESALEAEALARQAIEVDPHYAPAWEVLASALMQFYIQPYGLGQGEKTVLSEARAAAQRAVDLDPGFSVGHATLGFTLRWAGEHQASLAELRKAVALNPNDAAAHNMHGDVLGLTGNHRESIAAFATAARLDPFTPPLALALRARAHILLGEFDEALTLTRLCAERAPRLQACLFYLAVAASESGNTEEATRAVERVLAVNPQFSAAGHARFVGYQPDDQEKLAAMMRRAGLPG
jgi:TolB-like protein/DNA-binding winged helix-turn-helix (wHTH) protein/Tfp pilus assembly protein PilF